jgi:Mor family transcriptional regulator
MVKVIKVSRGEECTGAKLCEVDVREIRKLKDSGVPYEELVERYRVSHTAIYDLVKGRTWKHVKND